MANKWSADFYGKDPDDLKAMQIREFDKGEDTDLARLAQQRLLDTGLPVTQEYHQQVPDRQMVILNTIFPVRDAGGKIARIGGFSMDVTELHNARVALQQKRANLQACFDQVPVGIHMNRIGLRIADQVVELANDNIARPYGLTAGQFLALSPQAMAQDQILPLAPAFDAEILQTHRPVHAETLNPTTGRHESYTRFPILNAAGQITHIVGMVIDIDERVRAYDQLEEIRLLLSSIFDNIPAVLYLRELDGTFIMVNRWGAAVMGDTDPDVMIGRSAQALDSHEESTTARQAQATVVTTGQPVTQDYRRQVGGREMVVLNTIFPIQDASGTTIRIGGFATDVTELYTARNQLSTAQENLHQSEKLAALGQLLAGVAHELNNPLAVVLGRAAILQEKLAGTPHVASLQKLREAADRCARIVKTFLAMARQTGPRRQRTGVATLIESALDMTSYGLRSAGVTWSVAQADGLQVDVDPDQIVQVLINLILHAQHAMAGQTTPGHIDLRAGHTGDLLQITLAENGPGIPPAIALRIFDPFFTTKPIGHGTGLGLSVCKTMIEAHDGTLTLLDTAEGASFQISLPAAVTKPGSDHEEVGGGQRQA